MYHIDRIIRETGKVVDNGFEEIYVNTKVKDGSDISELMEVFVSDSVYNDKFPVTSKNKHRYKETEGGQQIMCEIMERIAIAEREEGREEGREEATARMNRLITILMTQKRYSDLERSTKDLDYQKKLLDELVPEE